MHPVMSWLAALVLAGAAAPVWANAIEQAPRPDRLASAAPVKPVVAMVWIYPVCTASLTDGCLDRAEAAVLARPLRRMSAAQSR